MLVYLVGTGFLFGFQYLCTWFGNPVDGFQGCIITAGIHVNFYQIAADFFSVRRSRKFIQELFEGSDGFAESGEGSFMQAKSVIVSCLFLDLHIGTGGGCLFESHAGFAFSASCR